MVLFPRLPQLLGLKIDDILELLLVLDVLRDIDMRHIYLSANDILVSILADHLTLAVAIVIEINETLLVVTSSLIGVVVKDLLKTMS